MKPKRRRRKISEARLPSEVQELLHTARRALEPHGWRVHVERYATFALVCANPVSPAEISFGVSHDLNQATDERRLREFLIDEAEFGRLAKAEVPKRKKRLLRTVRGSDALWSDEVYEQVVNMLHESRVIEIEEAEWLDTVGPCHFPDHVRRDLLNRMRSTERGISE
jgi:hypothetical protein